MSKRVIKFRVWDPEWSPKGGTMHYPEKLHGWAFMMEMRGGGIAFGEDGKKVSTHLVPLQFTGLHDADGREVYEGDILEYTWGPMKGRGVVEWVEHGFWLRGEDGRNHMPVQSLRRVIGNIYENPDLLTDWNLRERIERRWARDDEAEGMDE